MTETPEPKHARPPWWQPPLKTRRWAYGVLVAAAPVAVMYGLVSGEEAAALLVVAGAVLSIGGLALANPTKS